MERHNYINQRVFGPRKTIPIQALNECSTSVVQHLRRNIFVKNDFQKFFRRHLPRAISSITANSNSGIFSRDMGTAHKARRTGIPGTPTFLFRPLTMLCLLFSKISLHQRSFTRKWLQILMELKSRAIKAQMVTPVQRFVYRPHVSSKACDNVVNGVIRHTVYIQAPAIFLNACFRF